ncbi:MAG TPA: MBOAT family O-acyltransferase [Polyangiales bacterium]|nr:MBOAT family O-acyltransferase [Polyangiales bacterium]
MLFNSSTFLLAFLPIVLCGFLVLAGAGKRSWAGLWLTAASFVFYGWWDVRYVPLLLGSMLFNYSVGRSLARQPRRWLLWSAVGANVALLGFYKYTDFFLSTVNTVAGLDFALPRIVLPLAISFFTFQQIAYLSDAHDGEAAEHDFANYCLFITFFPHLIAGPITHHREMLPQFNDPENFRPRWDFLSVGATLFLVGLVKKVAVADQCSELVGKVFTASAHRPVQLIDAWGGALAYALQIYFDFSGYTDMAIGLGMLFCIRLPQNFNSPYKARNIIEFWSRWHMTLTRFLTAYIYNPITLRMTRARAAKGLPLPRRGRMTFGAWASLVVYPTLLTMLVSGLWHGAGWQFLMFGLLHGVYLCVAHGWHALKAKWGLPVHSVNKLVNAASVLVTFLCVVVALVYFRSSSVAAANQLLASMLGAGGLMVHPSLLAIPGVGFLAHTFEWTVDSASRVPLSSVVGIAAMLTVVWTLPNAQQWLRSYPTAIQTAPQASWLQRVLPVATWRPTVAFGLSIGAVGFFVIMRAISAAPTEFLYFQF